jgi:hypothetical protein
MPTSRTELVEVFNLSPITFVQDSAAQFPETILIPLSILEAVCNPFLEHRPIWKSFGHFSFSTQDGTETKVRFSCFNIAGLRGVVASKETF